MIVRDNGGKMRGIRGSLIDGLVAVEIIGCSNYKYSISSNVKAGDYVRHLPSRHMIIDGKLFYWSDNNYPLTQEMLDILWRYNLLEDDEGGLNLFPENPINDSKKGAYYYFCKKNLSKYKRVVTNKGFGYYQPPKLICK